MIRRSMADFQARPRHLFFSLETCRKVVREPKAHRFWAPPTPLSAGKGQKRQPKELPYCFLDSLLDVKSTKPENACQNPTGKSTWSLILILNPNPNFIHNPVHSEHTNPRCQEHKKWYG